MATQQPALQRQAGEVSVAPLRQDQLDAADRIFRLAFGTFLGLPDPTQFHGDADYVRTRWRAAPSAALGATLGRKLVGSNFVAHWGSVGFFGPLTVHPDLWDRGVGKQLLAAAIEMLDSQGVRHAGLFTFAHSPKHLALYQKFGFWPRFLTMVMSRPIQAAEPAGRWSKYSELPTGQRKYCLDACRELTGAIYDGLDLTGEIIAVDSQRLGDTLFLWDGDHLTGFAVCHCGAGSEAGSGTCYVKFGAVQPGSQAARDFDRLIEACNALAAGRSLGRLIAGVNVARIHAYRRMLELHFRIDFQGVTMHRPNESGYNGLGAYVLDDWR